MPLILARKPPDGYEHDVFISYRRDPYLKDWVKNVFYPLLTSDLCFEGMSGAKIFLDDDALETGQFFSDRINSALTRSVALVPVLTGDYFERPYCLTEFNHFWSRGPAERSRSFVFPVHFAGDTSLFPDEVKTLRYHPFEKYSVVCDHRCNSSLGIELRQSVKELAKIICRASIPKLGGCPLKHSPDWTVTMEKAQGQSKRRKLP